MRRPPGATVEAAGGVIVGDDGRIVVVHRPSYDDWSLPKGHLEAGEDHETAAIREVVEETGFECAITRDAGETRYLDHKGRPKRVRYFEMSITGGAFRRNDEVDAMRWIDPTDIDLLTHPDDERVVGSVWELRSARQRDE